MSTNRMGAVLLAAAGVLFLLYPAIRPWEDESTVEGATKAIGSDAWVASHLFAMLGFILVPLALLAIRVTGAALVTFWVGVGLTLPYYGAEDFALNAAAKNQSDLLAIVEDFRYGTVAVTTFSIGLLLIAVGAILTARAIARTELRWSAVLFAAGFALFLPQFFTPPAVRIAHGVLLAAGCVGFAVAVWRADAKRPVTAS
ncbi:hypothetical protein FKR81_10405 [Lentzea tibetensis]|uniref:DUF4386 family protein n=1 Tax=Lentzea tibetensis TaxID=2591470 RepID=A0A563EYA1_9PSEU|nr:hypothetical protein [Lentzea tibetensis]TWP52700.1 hypothetical protein FKR81_10405 [Lentzea tibetensis]